MKKQWQDIKIGDILNDGSKVTQIHPTHIEPCCKVIYSDTEEMICSYSHIFLVDVHELQDKSELESFCTYVPLEEDFQIFCEEELNVHQQLVINNYLHNKGGAGVITPLNDTEYLCQFNKPIKIKVERIITKSEPQKVDDNTYWLTCKGIKYLMDKYNIHLYSNGNIINDIIDMGDLPCFCISTDTGKYVI